MTKNINQKERSLVLIKPDGVQRSLVGELIKRYESVGFKLIGMKFLIPTTDQVEKHYLINDKWLELTGKKFINSYLQNGLKSPFDNPIKAGMTVLESLKKYLTSGPVIAIVWQGNEVVKIIRKITGTTEPTTSDVGTIRGDLTLDSYKLADMNNRAVRNLIHASGTTEEAEKEIEIWFNQKELIDYRLVQETILYDVNLDGDKE